MLVIIFSLLPLIYFGGATKDAAPSYRISMVSSQENRAQPAIFTHGESPVWDFESQTLYFVDVLARNVHQLDYNSGQISTKHIGLGQVNVVCPVANSRRVLVTVLNGLYLADLDVEGDSALRMLSAVELGQPNNVINEGKPDANGRFWFGTKGPQTGNDVLPDRASFYKFSQGCSEPHVMIRPISISNGLVFSLNDTVLYYIDSPTKTIDAMDFCLETGLLSNRRTVFDIRGYGYPDEAIPDGMTIDSDGHLWVALMFGGSVLHIDPDAGQLIFSYTLPVSQVTSLTWGGPNLDELFITTSRAGLDAASEPLAGAIFTMRGLGKCGMPTYHFKFDNADAY